MTQFLRDQASDSEEVVTPLMLDGTYLSRNFATLGPFGDSRRVTLHSLIGIVQLFALFLSSLSTVPSDLCDGCCGSPGL